LSHLSAVVQSAANQQQIPVLVAAIFLIAQAARFERHSRACAGEERTHQDQAVEISRIRVR
jgi:hypothetical protein